MDMLSDVPMSSYLRDDTILRAYVQYVMETCNNLEEAYNQISNLNEVYVQSNSNKFKLAHN